jgi:hypothetical protein
MIKIVSMSNCIVLNFPFTWTEEQGNGVALPPLSSNKINP